VVFPHFPHPRTENAATIVSGNVDAIEMMGSFGEAALKGIDAYSLLDWYRYLNCGYATAIVGGTDKMAATTLLGAMRAYADIGRDRAFSYDAFKRAVRAGRTFASCGPLLGFSVDGKPMGSRLRMPPSGGTVDVEWEAASVTVPATRVELIVNGEVRESRALDGEDQRGHWRTRIERSSWLALLVRGAHPGRDQVILAHSSAVMVGVDGSPFMSAADAVSILEQIQGAIAYLDGVAVRDREAHQRMRLKLTAIHRSLHNRMHRAGVFHDHPAVDDHHRR
jgi:hypothetical protein